MSASKKNQKLLRRKLRIRHKLSKQKSDLPRLTVYKSNKYIYAQIIKDGNILASASSISKAYKEKFKEVGKITVDVSARVGEMIAENAVKSGINNIIFDRSGYRYHGNVKSLAEAARNKGLNF